jgi:hypothetical protein
VGAIDEPSSINRSINQSINHLLTPSLNHPQQKNQPPVSHALHITAAALHNVPPPASFIRRVS